MQASRATWHVPVSSPVTPVKSSVRKLVCAKHVAQSNSRSVNWICSASALLPNKKPPAAKPAAFLFSIKPGSDPGLILRRPGQGVGDADKIAPSSSLGLISIYEGKNMIKVG